MARSAAVGIAAEGCARRRAEGARNAPAQRPGRQVLVATIERLRPARLAR